MALFLLISLGAPTPWGPSLAEALSRLPPPLRQAPGGVAWRLVVQPGATSTPEPAFDLAAGLLFVRPHPDVVVRRREVLFAALAAADAHRGWSASEDWRRFSGWSGPMPNAAELSLAPTADTPRRELAHFGARLLAPEGDPVDETAGCRQPARARFLEERLEALGWTRPPRRCPAFHRWARRDRLARVEVNYATPSTTTLGSVFGHFFLRLVYRDRRGAVVDLDSRVLTFLADVDLHSDPWYAVRGILGGYRSRLHDIDFVAMYQEYVFDEGRDVRRWALRLSPAETERLLERLWQGFTERRRYYFFTDNCATLTLRLVNDVIGGGVEPRGRMGASPAAVLDALAAARTPAGATRLLPLPQTFVSEGREALAEETRMLAVEDRLAVEPRLSSALRAAHHVDPEVRAAAYATVGARVAAGAGSAEAAAAWFRSAAMIEAHVAGGLVSAPLLAAQRAREAAATARPITRTAAEGWLAAQDAAWYRRARPRAGLDRVGLGATWVSGAPGLALEVAALDEQLGDQRRHGLGAETEFTLLRMRSRWDLGGAWPRLLGSEGRVVAYRTAQPRLRARAGWAAPLGVGWSLDSLSEDGRWWGRLRAGGLLPLARTGDLRHHLLLSADAEVEAGEVPGWATLGAPLGLEARLGDADHALRARAEGVPTMDLQGRLAMRYATRIEVSAALWTHERTGFSVRARLGGRLGATDGGDLDHGLDAGVVLE